MNDQTGFLEKIKPLLEDSTHLFPNYLSGLSHDIRTPLSAIIGFSDLLAEPRVSRVDQRNYCLMIARSSRKLLDLMSNLIDLAKMETGNLELFSKNVYIKDFVEDVKLEFREMVTLYDKNHLAITYSAPTDNLACVFTDKGRLFQIIKILLENSLRFTKEGGINLLIKEEPLSHWTIEIRDTGCGIDQVTMANLFDMFPPAEVSMAKKMKSRGMSLSVVKKLCDMMEISIEAHSQLGVGTVMRLSVPIKTR
ncbi:MAG: HAMP domain-containing sensor histidine kinase [Bacteroidales bacterium]|jgi:signal transduction histidine kinase